MTLSAPFQTACKNSKALASNSATQSRFAARLGTRAEAPTKTPAAERMARALKAEGFGFCGPTIVYAFMQATGMTNDHLVGCCRHAACAALAQPPR